MVTKMTEKAIKAGTTTNQAAGVMGRKGGRMKTPAQMAAYRRNAKLGGRPERYTYDDKVRCVMGVLNPKMCLMPLEVLANPKAHKNKTFPVKWKNQQEEFERYTVYFRYVDFDGTIEVDDKGLFHVQRFPSIIKVGERSEIPEVRRTLKNRNRVGRPSAPRYVVVDKKKQNK